MAAKLASGYIDLSVRYSSAMKQIGQDFGKLEGQGRQAGAKTGAAYGTGLSQSASRGAAQAGRQATSQFQTAAQAQGARVGTAVGTVIGKGIGAGIRVGMAGAAGAVTALGYTLTKGFQRLEKIDQARFKLQALGNSAADVDEIMKNAEASVKGTAFALDEAASSAASAVAAGIKPGKDLTRYLSNIADTASIAGTSFGEMASIFNKVTTNNKAYTDDLQMLADRGIPVFQLLREQYGTTAEGLQKMVEDGKVSAADLSQALESKLGGSAQKMGESFSGAMDNAHAAIARLGAKFLTSAFGGDAGHALDAPRDAVNALTEQLNKAGQWVDAHQGDIRSFFVQASEVVGNLFEHLTSIGTWLIEHEGVLLAIGGSIATAFAATKVAGLITSLQTLGGLLDGLPGKAGRAGGGLRNTLGGAGLTVGSGLAVTGATGLATDNGWANAGMTIGGGALAGASVAGPPGAAVGAAIGAIVTGFKALTDDIDNTATALDKFAQKLRDEAEKNPVLNPGHGVEVKPSYTPIPGSEIDAYTPLPEPLPIVDGFPVNPLTGGPPSVGGRNADKYNPPVQNTTPGMMPGLSASEIGAIAAQAEAATNGVGQLSGAIASIPDGDFAINPGTPAAQAQLDSFVAKNRVLPAAKLPIDIDLANAKAKLQALYNDVFRAPSGFTPPAGPPSNPILAGPSAAGYLPYNPAAIPRRASGGDITGPGQKGRDSVLMYGAPGEHVWTAKEVDAVGGQRAMYQLRAQALSGGIPGFNKGGVVPMAVPWGVDPIGGPNKTPSAGRFTPWWDMDWLPPENPEEVGPGNGKWWHRGPTPGKGGGWRFPPIGDEPGYRKPLPSDIPGPDPRIKVWGEGIIPGYENGGAIAAIDYAYGANGTPYQYGSFDCSMFASQVYAQMAGLPPGRYFNTESDFEAMGFKPGYKPGALNVGIRRGGGGPNSHMGVTLPNGVSAENTGNGAMYGGNAKGAQTFPLQYYFEAPNSGDMGAMQSQAMGQSVDPNTTQHGMGMGAAPGPLGSTYAPGEVGRTEGFIPAAAGNTSVAGTSFLSGIYGMGAEVINGVIDQAASAASSAAGMAASAFAPGSGGAAGGLTSAAIGIGTQAAKRGVEYGAQMLGIGTDAIIEQLTPFGAPRLLTTDPTGFMPQQLISGAISSGIAGAINPKQQGETQAAPGVPNPPQQQPLPGPPQQPSPLDFLKPIVPTGIYDQGGWLPPGGVAVNKTRKAEPMPVFNHDQWGTLNAIANSPVSEPDTRTGGNDYRTIIENVTVKDVSELERQMEDRRRLNTMRYRGRG